MNTLVDIALAVIAVIGTIASVVSVVYAIMTNREKARLEKLIQAELRGFAGNIDQICGSPGWANRHFEAIQEHALKLERNQDVHEILRNAQQGVGDSVAAERMIRNLLNQVLTLQEGMFGTRDRTHVDQVEKN